MLTSYLRRAVDRHQRVNECGFREGIVPEVNLRPIPQDEQRVNIFDEAEAKYWAKRFGCTRAQLEAAVMKVGVMTKSVEKEVKGK
jgi:uncharacterized protein DUF3606